MTTSSSDSWGAQLKATGGKILTAPARVNPVPIIISAVPATVKESVPGRLVRDAYSALTFDWDEGDSQGGNILAKVPAFNAAAKEDPVMCDELFKRMTGRSFAAGETLMSRGDPGVEMFYITHGEVGVHLDPSAPAVATLVAGDICGEGALLNDEPRAAHVLAVEETGVLVLSKGDLDELLPLFPALQAGMAQFSEDRTAELEATAGAKMERFVQAREQDKEALTKKVRRLAVEVCQGWFLISWVGILLIWGKMICGAIDGDLTPEESRIGNAGSGSNDGSFLLADTDGRHTPCVEAAYYAYQFMRIFMSVGPALFIISEFDIDAAAIFNPWKARFCGIGASKPSCPATATLVLRTGDHAAINRCACAGWHATVCLLGWVIKGEHWWRLAWPSIPSGLLIVYLLVLGGPCVRQEGRHPRLSTILIPGFLAMTVTWGWSVSFCMVSAQQSALPQATPYSYP
eukprot:SAG25_NODE_3_length_30426_cov_8.268210_14_plen_460_part_00